MDLLFHFKGSIYEAKVLANYSEPIHCYRCYFSDKELRKAAGDCITFNTHEDTRRLELVYYADKSAYNLINSLQSALQKYIDNNTGAQL